MASPLSLYIPIQQTLGAQAAAQVAYSTFTASVGPELDQIQNVHYARISIIKNPAGAPFPINAILLITDFDESMTDYLNAFWVQTNVKAAFIGLASIMEGGPAHPENFNFDQFRDFIVTNNLNKEVPAGSGKYEAFYEAYPGVLVSDIVAAFPPKAKQ